MISFSELTKQVHLINDLILSDMVCSDEPEDNDQTNFSRHLLATKQWFSRISWANKKRYLLALLEDIQSAWALSLLLKSMWNCRPKDSVLSISEQTPYSSYDQVPMDHNRTATPLTVLAQVMTNDRMWFISQEPESQAMILSELLTIAGGPVMWVILRRAQHLYDRYSDFQLQNMQDCVSADKPSSPKSPTKSPPKPPHGPTSVPGKAQKELEANLAIWNATIKSMKDSTKLEEFEMSFIDGTKKKIWKVNRPKPEAIETVDFIQLLPSSIAKRIFSYLPRAQITDYSKVNKYWAYVIDELRAEQAARQKIDVDRDRLKEIMLCHDISLDVVDELPQAAVSSQVNVSTGVSLKMRPQPSTKASEKSGAALSLRHFLNEKLNKPEVVIRQRPLRNLAELSERLDSRGAVDENLWKWCANIQKRAETTNKTRTQGVEGILPPGNAYFPCPMMSKSIAVPLETPLCKDPAITAPFKSRRNVSSMMIMSAPADYGTKRFSLWTRNFSSLYPVLKIPAYQVPF